MATAALDLEFEAADPSENEKLGQLLLG